MIGGNGRSRPVRLHTTKTQSSRLPFPTSIPYVPSRASPRKPSREPRMLRSVQFGHFLALIAVVQATTAFAQDKECVPLSCRAVYRFKTCDRPNPGAAVFSGRVVSVSRECSNTAIQVQIVKVQIEDGEANMVPPVVEIVVQPCGRFFGKVGDLTRIAVMNPTPTTRRYDLACRFYGGATSAIGPSSTSSDVRYRAVVGSEADIRCAGAERSDLTRMRS